jgi:hypothetical protein
MILFSGHAQLEMFFISLFGDGDAQINLCNIIGGDEGSSPSNFSATTAWAELETGRSSVKPCTTARTTICKNGITEL